RPEVPRAYLPDQVSTIFCVMGADPSFTGVVCEVSHAGSCVERLHGVGAERTKTHGRNIQDARAVRLFTVLVANQYPGVVIDLVEVQRNDGVTHPFITFCVRVELSSEWCCIDLPFGALVDDRP